MNRPLPSVTVLLPAHNEAETILRAHAAIAAELMRIGCPFEIICIDDGSTDETATIWKQLMERNGRLGLVSFTRNFGKETALLAGFERARGDVVIPMDADLQDPTEVLEPFIDGYRNGFDMVYGVRRRRDESLGKRLAARVHYRLLNLLSPIHIPEEAGDFRLLARVVVQDILRLPERDRYTKGLYAWAGRPAMAVPYDRPARSGGQPKQSLRRLVNLALDGVISFSTAPLRIMLWLGMLSCAVALAYFAWLFTAIFILQIPTPPGYPTIICLVLFFGGLSTFGIGIICEYLARIYREVKQRPHYLIREERHGAIA